MGKSKKNREGETVSHIDFIKVKVKEYIDLWDESDEVFARMVLTIVRRHRENN